MQAKLPISYESFFRNRTIIIMGVGRSGTTILGKLLCSMSPTYYLFEPTILRTMRGPHHLGTLFEDYYLPIIQGSIVNDYTRHYGDPDDYWATYKEMRDQRKQTLNNRVIAIGHIAEEKPLFVIKSVNIQPYASDLREIFPQCDFIHIVRNGFDVIKSSLTNHWYSDYFFTFQDEFGFVLDINGDPSFIPWYIDEEVHQKWFEWNPLTRAAYLWSFLVDIVQPTLQYERLCSEPELIVSEMEKMFGISRTKITERHIDNIERHVPRIKTARKAKNLPGASGYEKITLGMIAEPVREKFAKTMIKNGYEV